MLLHLLRSAYGTSRTSGGVRRESAKWAKADIDEIARRFFALAVGRERALDANRIEGLDFGQAAGQPVDRAPVCAGG
jgi:hypothetical protein